MLCKSVCLFPFYKKPLQQTPKKTQIENFVFWLVNLLAEYQLIENQ